MGIQFLLLNYCDENVICWMACSRSAGYEKTANLTAGIQQPVTSESASEGLWLAEHGALST